MKKLVVLLLLLLLTACSGSTQKPKSGNTLVVYFSVTNNTEALANYAKEHLNCDIFEIVPAIEYTKEDIDYNRDCRAKREQDDDDARPEIKNMISDISQYDIIVLGYPIWFGQAPKILYTFVESYDLTDKTIIPFCTSGSSSIGSSAKNLAKSAPDAKWEEGRRFSASAKKEEIASWLDTYIMEETAMKLFIDGKELNVSWENNASTKAINKITPLIINARLYGGFEQVGSIGKTIVSDDKRMTTEPGDIVLYSSNQIVVFFGNNTWEYTKLGHINLSENELNDLLNKDNVTISIK